MDYRADPVPPSQVNGDVPPELGDITMRAIATSIDERYATPAEFKAGLQELINR